MIISRTPFRISFFGGGTDYPLWYRQHGGAVLSTAIDKYAYITCRHLPPFFEHKHRIVYSQIERVNDTPSIDHPAVRGIFEYLDVNEGLEMHYDADLPARSGIGSSSSFTVGLLNAVYALRGEMKSARELADTALHVEQNVIGEAVGSQDQIAAAFGGFNRINFNPDDSYSVRPLILAQSRARQFNDRLMLFFTGFSRLAANVAKAKMANFGARESLLTAMYDMVDEAQNLLSTGDLDDVGRLLHTAWEMKKGLSEKVSTDAIDEMYAKGLRHGALGGKLLGAGGGGFLLFYVPLERQNAVREAFGDLIEVDFSFAENGSEIVHYNPGSAIYRKARPGPSRVTNGFANEGLRL